MQFTGASIKSIMQEIKDITYQFSATQFFTTQKIIPCSLIFYSTMMAQINNFLYE